MMFLHLLNTSQKQAFFSLAQRTTLIDGEQDRSELRKLDDLKRRLALPDTQETDGVLGDLDVSAFDTRQSRCVAMMEILALAYSDDYLDEAESNMISDIAVAFGFNQDDLTRMAEWAMSSLELVSRGEAMIDG